jgi:hypothetical protein
MWSLGTTMTTSPRQNLIGNSTQDNLVYLWAIISMNARRELIESIKGINANVTCWSIKYAPFGYDADVESILKKGYSDEEFNAELNKLDFEYDDGYGSQEVYGFVIFDDNSWLERGEYDGSEWWVHQKTPVLPECE